MGRFRFSIFDFRFSVAVPVLVLAGVVASGGCETTPTADRGAGGSAEPIDLTAAVAAHNRRVRLIERCWARATVELEWTDEEGKEHWEQGDGPLIVRRPDRLALAIGKAGNTLLYLGANGERFWMLDLNADPAIAYVGGGPAAVPDEAPVERLPLPIRPDHLIELLGFTPLPPPEEAGSPYVRTDDGRASILLAGEDPDAGLLRRLVLDRRGRVRQVELITPDSRLVLRATLDDYEPIPTVPPAPDRQVPTYIALETGDGTGSATLFLSQLTSEADRIRDAAFDFRALRQVYGIGPEQIRRVVAEPVADGTAGPADAEMR